MSNQKKFSTYGAILKALKRDEVFLAGSTATLLLECFVHNHGELKASMVEGRGCCELGKFKIWRESLIKKGWITYSIGEYSRHYPGAKMIKYVNKEKLSKEEVATTKELRKVDKKVEAMQEEISLLKAAVKNMIEEFDPPVTEEKVQRRLKVVREK